jgi:hypothetical protein
MALHERLAEVGRERRLLWRHRDEVQKDVRAENNEPQSEQDAGDGCGNFHAVMLNRMGDISTGVSNAQAGGRGCAKASFLVPLHPISHFT